MIKDTLTLALEGEIALEAFARAIRRFNGLVQALSKDLSGEADVEWIVEDLYASSAVATVRGICETVGVVDRIVDGYAEVGDALAVGREIPFSTDVRKRATALTGMLGERISSMRFETAERDVIIAARPSKALKPRGLKYSFGTVKGTVQMLTMRRGLRFSLYDALFDKAVSCYLRGGQEEHMREAWGKRAAVSGSVGRDPDYGRPVVVRDVTDVSVVMPPEAGSYKRARGVVPWTAEDEPPEAIIRRLRDEEWPLTELGGATVDDG